MERDRYAWVIGTLGILILVVLSVVVAIHWKELVAWSGLGNGTFLRNLFLAYVAAMAFVLAFWRSALASRQSARGDQGLQNERYQKGADMLGSGTLATRLGGVYALERLAKEHPEEYYRQARDLLCALFVTRQRTTNSVRMRRIPKNASICVGAMYRRP